MKKTKNKKVAKNIGAILISSTLCISTLGISYAYFGEYIISDVDVTTAQMSIENIKSGKIEYNYSQKKLIITFELQNTGDVPVTLYIKNAKATMNRFFMETDADYVDFSGDDGERSFLEADIESFDGQELEVGDEAEEFVLEFTDVYVEDYENAYFETEIEIEYVYSEAESWKGTVEIKAVDENRKLQAQKFLEYMESKDSETTQPEAVVSGGGGGGGSSSAATPVPAPETSAPEAEDSATPEIPETTAEPEASAAPETSAPEAEATETTAEPEVSAPKVEASETETPKLEAPKTEVTETAAPKAEVPKTEATETAAPKAEAPKTEATETAAPKAEAPKTEAPKAESSQSSDPGDDAN